MEDVDWEASDLLTAEVRQDLLPGNAPPWYLLAITAGSVQLHELPAGRCTVLGRSRACGVVLDFDSVSRRHAQIRVDGACTLTDLGSRNGTTLRGQRLRSGESRPVRCGDSFSIGPVSMMLVPRTAMNATNSAMQPDGSRVRIDDVEIVSTPLMSAVARARLSVVIYGETGVGKELLAQTIHRYSERTGPFVAINCAALTESLLESELFGHERGSFTGAIATKPGLLVAATGGTLLLDEIGEMAPAVQAKLLRAIETQTVSPVGSVRSLPIDVRFVAATHRDLFAEVERGNFRRDLYYRLAGLVVEIPALRERMDRIPRLALQLLNIAAKRNGMLPPRITPDALAALQAHTWPGNVRELRNVLDRAVLFAGGGSIEVGHLVFDTARGSQPSRARSQPVGAGASLRSGDDERSRILSALEACAGNQTRAARMLAMSRTTLIHKVRFYGIPRPRAR